MAWTNDDKPNEAPYIWTLISKIWDVAEPAEYIEFPWQREAPSIWTNDSVPS